MRRFTLAFLAIWGAAAADLRLATALLAPGRAGRAYLEGPIAVASGGACPAGGVAVRVAAGRLPEGLTLDGAGYLSGTPRDPGRYRFTLETVTACSRVRTEAELEIQIPALLFFDEPRVQFQCEKGGPPPAGRRLLLRGSQPGAAYQLHSSAPWLVARPRRGALPGAGAALDAESVEIEVLPEKLPIGTHTARLTAVVWGAAQNGDAEIRLTIDPAGAAWPGLRTRPAILDPLVAKPELVLMPSVMMEPPAPKRTMPVTPISKLVHKVPPKRTVKSTGGPMRSRIIPVPKIALPPAPEGPSKLLGPPMKEPPTAPEKKKPEKPAGGH